MKRIVKSIAAIVLILAVLFALYIFVISPATWESSVTSESIRILEAAQTDSELAAAVGDLGAFYSFPDGSWVAIRYRDSHSGGVFSSAVVRDSGGEWFYSNHHFCGRFSYYSYRVERRQEFEKAFADGVLTEVPNLAEEGDGIHTLATSPDLATARKNLIALGFEKMER